MISYAAAYSIGNGSYMLHILKQHLIFGSILIEEYWDNWCCKWEESRFKLYKGIDYNYMNKAVDIEIGAPICRRLNVREITEAQWLTIMNWRQLTTDWPRKQRDEAIRAMDEDLDKMSGLLPAKQLAT